MDRNIHVEIMSNKPLEHQGVEIVERKGIGHPDSIADALSESVSKSLSKMYLEKQGMILHHNTDETQIVGGQSAPKFGGGELLEPIYILLVGRAITQIGNERLPYRVTAMKAAREYLRNNFPNLDIDLDVTLDCKIGKGSVDLTALYDTQKLNANDTSFGVGFAPFTETETLTYELEGYLNVDLKKQHPEIGEDIKVMSSRYNDEIHTTVAIAMVDRYIPDKDHYISSIESIKEELMKKASTITDRNVNIDINTADDYNAGNFYITVTGLSMENGDDGSVGRGNRVSGLITPYRPMSMEAAAGKNPVTHVGKLYNVLATDIANKIVGECGCDVIQAHVRILSQIGSPIDRPKNADIQLWLAEGADTSKVTSEAQQIADQCLADVHSLTDRIINGNIRLF